MKKVGKTAMKNLALVLNLLIGCYTNEQGHTKTWFLPSLVDDFLVYVKGGFIYELIYIIFKHTLVIR